MCCLLCRALQLSFCGLVYPCLVVTYMGQASYLAAHPDAYTGEQATLLDPGHAPPFWPCLCMLACPPVCKSGSAPLYFEGTTVREFHPSYNATHVMHSRTPSRCFLPAAVPVDPFWKSVPSGAFWPMLVVATAASVVASQALISGVYSIMRQASVGCRRVAEHGCAVTFLCAACFP